MNLPRCRTTDLQISSQQLATHDGTKTYSSRNYQRTVRQIYRPLYEEVLELGFALLGGIRYWQEEISLEVAVDALNPYRTTATLQCYCLGIRRRGHL